MTANRRRRGRSNGEAPSHRQPRRTYVRKRDPERIREERQRVAREAFFGDASDLPEPPSDVRMTDDPHAVPRSLGPPPLRGHEEIAEHYFAAVYDRAVSMAGALATVGGLIDPDDLSAEPED